LEGISSAHRKEAADRSVAAKATTQRISSPRATTVKATPSQARQSLRWRWYVSRLVLTCCRKPHKSGESAQVHGIVSSFDAAAFELGAKLWAGL
jgi:hypothetical protein